MRILKALALISIPSLLFAGIHVQEGDSPTFGGVTASSITASSITASNIGNNQCVQAGPGGLLIGVGFPCGSGSGSGNGGYAVQPATVPFNLAQGVSGSTFSFIGPTQSTVAYGVSVGSITFTGSGNPSFSKTGDTTLYQFVGSSTTPSVGHLAVWSSSMAIIDGGTAGSVAPGGNQFDIQVASPGVTAITGYDNFTNNGTTVTYVGISSITISNITGETATGVLFNYIGSSVAVSSFSVSQNGTGAINAAVITSTGTGIPLQVLGQGSPGGGVQQRQGYVTIGDDTVGKPVAAQLVLVDSTTDSQIGAGVLEIWEDNPNHNDPIVWVRRNSSTSGPEFRVDGLAPNFETVDTSTANPVGRGKYEIYAQPFQSEILQMPNSRCWDNTSFESEAYWEPLNIQSSIGTPGIYLKSQDSTGCDSGVVISSNTGGINFYTQNSHTVGLTGPLNVAAGSWRFRLPHTLNNQGQILYQANNGDTFNDRPWEFTTGGSSQQVLTNGGTGAPYWSTVSGGGGGPNGTITTSPQFQMPYYSTVGSSNVLTGISTVTWDNANGVLVVGNGTSDSNSLETVVGSNGLYDLAIKMGSTADGIIVETNTAVGVAPLLVNNSNDTMSISLQGSRAGTLIQTGPFAGLDSTFIPMTLKAADTASIPDVVTLVMQSTGVTISSNTTIAGNFIVNRTMTISSNTVLPGATFYSNGAEPTFQIGYSSGQIIATSKPCLDARDPIFQDAGGDFCKTLNNAFTAGGSGTCVDASAIGTKQFCNSNPWNGLGSTFNSTLKLPCVAGDYAIVTSSQWVTGYKPTTITGCGVTTGSASLGGSWIQACNSAGGCGPNSFPSFSTGTVVIGPPFTPASYNTGTIISTPNVTEITGSGTAWDSSMAGGLLWVLQSGSTFFDQISSVTSTTHLTLKNGWEGNGLNAFAYTILKPDASAVLFLNGQGSALHNDAFGSYYGHFGIDVNGLQNGIGFLNTNAQERWMISDVSVTLQASGVKTSTPIACGVFDATYTNGKDEQPGPAHWGIDRLFCGATVANTNSTTMGWIMDGFSFFNTNQSAGPQFVAGGTITGKSTALFQDGWYVDGIVNGTIRDAHCEYMQNDCIEIGQVNPVNGMSFFGIDQANTGKNAIIEIDTPTATGTSGGLNFESIGSKTAGRKFIFDDVNNVRITNSNLPNGGNDSLNYNMNVGYYTSPATFASPNQSTFTYGVTMGSANITNSLTVSSNTLLSGASFYNNAPSQINSIVGNTVTISSNTILPGATFYAGGASAVIGTSSGTTLFISSVTISTGTQIPFTASNISGSLRIAEGASGFPVAISFHNPGTGAVTGYIKDALTGALTVSQAQGQTLELRTNDTNRMTIASNGNATFLNGILNTGTFTTLNSSVQVVSPITGVYSTTFGTSTANYEVAVTTLQVMSVAGSSLTATSCGTSPSVTGTNAAFTITPGGSASGCTVTFNPPLKNTPTCVISPQTESITNALSYTESNTAIVFTQTSMTSKVDVHCWGQNE